VADAEGITFPPVKRALPLIGILSSLALGASIVRGLAQLQLLATMNGSITARTVLLLEFGNWLGWTTWAVVLVLLVERLHARQAGGAGIVTGGLLALAPLVVVPVFSSPWHWLVTFSPGLMHSAAHIMGHNLPTNLLLGVAMVAVVQGRASRERTQRLEQTASDLRAQLAESQLAVLRARLDPHFLFNALNSAMVLARRGETQKVEQVLDHLSMLLRHSLDAASAQVVPLRVELEVLRHYVDIEQVRHGERLVVQWNVDRGLDDRLVPSMVLQPIVENAIRHGLADPSRVLTVEIAVRNAGDSLVLSVQDDGKGLAEHGEEPAEGIGLGHTRARLAGLYGERAYLRLERVIGGRGARVTIGLPDESRTTSS
jgi:signal transduction histidine kinase